MNNNLFFDCKNVSVLGASGKMGRGIVLLLARTILQQNIQFKSDQKIIALDISQSGLKQMLIYIEIQSAKYAEKNIEWVHRFYGKKNHASESDFVDLYVEDIKKLIQPTDKLEDTYGSELIFEAVAEKIDVKTSLFEKIDKNSKVRPYFFTNTSSIPISSIETKAKLKGRLIGLHFYNPPPVQKLLEIIRTDQTEEKLFNLAVEIGQLLNKTIVYAPDFAGFIGNGQFLREVSYAADVVQKISSNHGFTEAMLLVNELTRDVLLRPMGIFEVVDYVGIDVCNSILSVMQEAFPNETFNDTFFQNWIKSGQVGGQDTKGHTKNGIFKYGPSGIIGIFDTYRYKSITPLDLSEITSHTWQELKSDVSSQKTLEEHFKNLHLSKNNFSRIAVEYGKECNKIGEKLVAQKIAFSENDVNQIMTLGFHHLYGPINSFFDGSMLADSLN
jgi:3-hydroxyacyl-CoA dehydrogenase